jgi:hypothetical protein
VRSVTIYVFAFTLLLSCLTKALSQTWSFEGQASGWLTSHPETTPISQTGLRYLPQITVEVKLTDEWQSDVELALNAFTTASFAKNQSPRYDGTVKPYRGWLRFSSSTFEARIGLQKLSFGSATMMRPLMWFDAIDPRDPLQMTDGVYGMLLRYYFLNNTNIWLWGLYGNNEKKGWEVTPTRKNSAEYGGRVQAPLWSGEMAISYDHRNADLGSLISFQNAPVESSGKEDRFGLDGKWDVGPGVWFEAAVIHSQSDLTETQYQRQWTVGADYRFDLGEGLTVMTEYLRTEASHSLFGSADGTGFSALSLNYPLGLIDRLSGILFYDWTNAQWYRLMTWQRTYDDWTLYVQGFWNPETIRLYQNQGPNNSFAGTGLRFMLVFNH